MKKVLIQDIARELGLSRNTVANALKNDAVVLEATRYKVIKKAFEMGYQKLNPEVLEGLEELEELREEKLEGSAANRRYVILMGAYAEDDFWNGVVWGITERIRREKGSCILAFVSPDEERQLVIPNTLLSEEIQGIMCLTIFSRKYADKICSLGIPMVFMDAPVMRIPYVHEHDIILLEGAQSIYAITRDLICRGCVTLGFFGDITYCESIYDRWRGFRLAMKDSGKKVDNRFCITEENEVHYYSGESIEAKLEEMKDLPDAMVCANDYIAINVMQYCKRKGISVPAQLAVTGFDNKRDCLIMEPHITTVHTTNRRIGMRIADQLLWRIKNPAMHKEIIKIATEPYIRESSAR